MSEGLLLGISGSLRSDSVNRKLVREAARLYAPARFIEADINFPLYDGDLESAEGLPASVQTLVDQIEQAEAVVISTPEYNKGPSGVLKNALDWVSRTRPNPWLDKPVALMSATGGRAGGERTQWIMRLSLNPFRPRLLVGPEVLVGGAAREFDAEGRLTNERYLKALQDLMDGLRAEARLG